MTKSEVEIAKFLDTKSSFASAQEIFLGLKGEEKNFGLATIYRALQRLTASGEVDVLRRSDGEALYRKCGEEHHHHLICKTCGKTVEIPGAGVEDWANSVAARHGFEDIHHSAEIYGTCAGCSNQAKPNRR
ncbi:MAG TPA: Fur family transcriptional regulator [Candidatus Nanopelagicaceae bacterium]|nr:Fur family transcriptional regulator [Candidatus Nanopelagicaceae bacterium]